MLEGMGAVCIVASALQSCVVLVATFLLMATAAVCRGAPC